VKTEAQWALDMFEALTDKSKPEDRQKASAAMAHVLRRQARKPLDEDPLRAMPFSLGDVVRVCRSLKLKSADVVRLFAKIGPALEASTVQVTEALEMSEAEAAKEAAEEDDEKAEELKQQAADLAASGTSNKGMFDEATATGHEEMN